MSFNRGFAPRLFQVGLRDMFTAELRDKEKYFSKFCFEASSSKEDEKQYSMHGIYSIPQKSEGANYTFQDPSPGNYKLYTHLTYAGGLRFTKEAKEDELYGFLSSYPGMLSDAMHETMELIGHEPLNNGIAQSENGPDGVPLGSIAHPMANGNVQSNYVQQDLGYGSLTDALVAFKTLRTWEGYPMAISDNKLMLIAHDSNDYMGSILTEQGNLEPFSGHNTKNYLSKYNIEWVADPYIADTDAWVISRKPNKRFMLFLWRVRPQYFFREDPINDDGLHLCRMRCSAGYFDWQQFFISAGE